MNTTTQIRFTKTPEITEMLEDFKYFYKGLSESEIFKLAFSKFWRTEIPRDKNGFTLTQQKNLDNALLEAKRGEIEGPFNSMEEFLADLKK